MSRPRCLQGSRPAGLVARPPTRGQQILCDLAARLGTAHNENSAWGQRTRSAVVRSVLLSYPVRKGVGQRRQPRDVLVATGRHDDSPRLENLVAGLDDVSGAVVRQPYNLGSRVHRTPGGQHVQPLHHFSAGSK